MPFVKFDEEREHFSKHANTGWVERVGLELGSIDAVEIAVCEKDDDAIDNQYIYPVEVRFYSKDDSAKLNLVTTKGFDFGSFMRMELDNDT